MKPDRLWIEPDTLEDDDAGPHFPRSWTVPDNALAEYALVEVSDNLKATVLRFEASLIIAALRRSGGRVLQASRLLNMNSHQALLDILHNRHKELLPLCTQLLGPRSRKHGSG